MEKVISNTIIGLLCIFILGVGTSTAANYRVTVDCNHSNLRNTDTGNRITVSFLDSGGNLIRTVSRAGIRNCARSDSAFSIDTNRVVRYIEFGTNGNDAFFIDEWRLFRNGARINWEGRDNGRGWCLSTDPRDASGPWQGFVTGGCRSRIRFPVAAGSAPPAVRNFRVTVDCNHTAISNEETGNRITVSFLDANRNIIRNVSHNGIGNCARNEAGFSINTSREVRYIDFATNGNDAFYIDEWRLFLDGRQIRREGSDDGSGWCLSTDPGDAAGPWQGFVTGGCRSRIRFPVAGATTVGPVVRAYKVTVDCNHTAISNEETGNRITVSFLDANRDLIRRVAKNGIRNCAGGEAVFTINTSRVVAYIEFSTNGNDAFYIDEWRLFLNGGQVVHQGVDNGRGWCLSTDPNDAAGPWRGYVTGGCKTRLRFP